MSETIRGLKEILLKLNELHSVLLEENSNTIPLLSDSVVNLIRLVSTSTHNLRSYVSSVDIKEADLVDCLAKVEKIAKIQKQEILSLKKDFIREKDNATTMTEFFPCCECSKKDFFIEELQRLSAHNQNTINSLQQQLLKSKRLLEMQQVMYSAGKQGNSESESVDNDSSGGSKSRSRSAGAVEAIPAEHPSHPWDIFGPSKVHQTTKTVKIKDTNEGTNDTPTSNSNSHCGVVTKTKPPLPPLPPSYRYHHYDVSDDEVEVHEPFYNQSSRDTADITITQEDGFEYGRYELDMESENIHNNEDIEDERVGMEESGFSQESVNRDLTEYGSGELGLISSTDFDGVEESCSFTDDIEGDVAREFDDIQHHNYSSSNPPTQCSTTSIDHAVDRYNEQDRIDEYEQPQQYGWQDAAQGVEDSFTMISNYYSI